jgi:hypothetical protein
MLSKDESLMEMLLALGSMMWRGLNRVITSSWVNYSRASKEEGTDGSIEGWQGGRTLPRQSR